MHNHLLNDRIYSLISVAFGLLGKPHCLMRKCIGNKVFRIVFQMLMPYNYGRRRVRLTFASTARLLLLTLLRNVVSNVNTLIKWPGGKTREIKHIASLIPSFQRYIEPFFGGGAMFFYLEPEIAVINDISADLMDFYELVKKQDTALREYLIDYCSLWEDMLRCSEASYDELLFQYLNMKSHACDYENNPLRRLVERITNNLRPEPLEKIIGDIRRYKEQLYTNALDKMCRTATIEGKRPFSAADLKENLITGLLSGVYMYFRNVYNEIHIGDIKNYNKPFRVANFYFIREYCYGSMFRYNKKGEFNIPYGGMSYNRKDFRAKIEDIFNQETERLFSKADVYNKDFEELFDSLEFTPDDFMFLDPPYDTDFSEYEGRAFTRKDQQRLAEALRRTKAQFILIIKNTDFIYSLYQNDFNIMYFDKKYSYNVRSRNERNAEHLVVTNILLNGGLG